MTRRDLLKDATLGLAASRLALSAPTAATLPDTQPLDWQGDLAERMMDGAHKFVERKIAESITTRPKFWARDLSSREAYEKSIEPNRARFRHIIGAEDARLQVTVEKFGDDQNPALVAEFEAFRVYQVRWPVLEGVYGEGLLLEPKSKPAGYVVALTDADQTPEQIVGLAPGVAAENQFARRLAESGFEILIPTLVDRTARWSGHADIRVTDQPHREWIYRQAYQMGRHIIGYEVQKVMAAVDWFSSKPDAKGRIGVAGYAEGGLIAFYSAAADPRIDAVLVSGYFDSRQAVWSEPIYRNVWSLLREFGDAEIASLIAPRGLVVEYSRAPDITSTKGELKTPKFESVSAEFTRIDSLTKPEFQPRRLICGSGSTPCGPASQDALKAFTHLLGSELRSPRAGKVAADQRQSFRSGRAAEAPGAGARESRPAAGSRLAKSARAILSVQSGAGAGRRNLDHRSAPQDVFAGPFRRSIEMVSPIFSRGSARQIR